MDNAHICQAKFLQINTVYVVHKILDKIPHFLKCGSRHAGSTSINVLHGTLSMVLLVWLLHVKWLLPASDSHLNVWKDILKISR